MGKANKFLSNFLSNCLKPKVIIYLFTSVGSTILNKWILENLCFPALGLAAIHFFVIFAISLMSKLFCVCPVLKCQQTFMTLLILSSIACLNKIFTLLSMYENTLIVHMVSKTLTVPFILLSKELVTRDVEKVTCKMLWKKYIPLKLMILGGFLVFNKDVESRGFLYLLFAIMNSAIYQTVSGNKRGKVHCPKISAMYYQSPIATVLTLFFIACTDSYDTLKTCYWSKEEWMWILFSGALMYFSQYNCLHVLDTTDALTFNVLTQVKTLLVLLISKYFIPESVTSLQYFGLFLNILGGILITYFRILCTPRCPPTT